MARILVVDDSAEVRFTLSELLADAGHEVLEASSGAEAIELALSHQPDVALLDQVMPGVDGLETLRRLKADSRTSSIEAIMVTGWGERDLMMQAVEAGARDYITKPWRDGEVQMCVKWALAAADSAWAGRPLPANSAPVRGRLLIG